jgi:hypothetical protein
LNPKVKSKTFAQQRDTCTAAFAASSVQQLADTRVPDPSAGDGFTPVKEDSVDDEEVLRLEYELKLARLRAAKGFVASMAQPVAVGGSALRSPSSAAASPSGSPTGTLKLHRSSDGSYRLQPREVKIEPNER